MAEPSIFIIGTDHRYQNLSADFSEKQHRKFAKHISEIIQLKRIVLISEENNIEAVNEANIENSSLQIIAGEMGIHHLFTEPNRAYRAVNDIEQENDIRILLFSEGSVKMK